MGDHNTTITYNDYLNTIRGKPIMSIIITFDDDNIKSFEWRGNDQIMKNDFDKIRSFVGLVPNFFMDFLKDSLEQINISEKEKLRLIRKGKEYLRLQYGR